MHLAIEAVGAKHSGGAVVFADIVAAAAVSPRVSRLTLFTSPRPLRNFDLPSGPHITEHAMPAVEGSLVSRISWYERGLGRAAANVGADVVLCMSGFGNTRGGPPHVTFIQQSLPYCPEALATLSLPERVRMLAIRAMVGRSVRDAVAVFTQTPTMVEWIQREFGFTQTAKWYMPPTRELPIVTESPPEIAPMLAVPKGARLLYVGNTSAYKNVPAAIAAVTLLRRTLPHATLFLTWPKSHPVAGTPGVVLLGYLDPYALAAAYDAADILVQTSLVESGPLTMNEAMSRGTPVVCADRPYGHDLCETAALFFDPRSPEDLAATSLRMISDAQLRDRLVADGYKLVQRRRDSAPYDQMMLALTHL